MGKSITITEAVHIAATPEAVWDFTQDYSRRHEWDSAVASAKVIAEKPLRTVQIRGLWLCCQFHYKLLDRPRRTTLAMSDVESRIIEGGGGSWAYEAEGKGTRWTQTNTIILREGPILSLFSGVMAWSLHYGTRKAMRRAKKMIEGERAY